jgi:ATP-dependent DNA helicase RecG
MTQDELLAKLDGIEWNDFECKRAKSEVPKDAYKTVSAFANTAGGWLVFGVSERDRKLELSGIEAPDVVQNDLLSTLRAGQKLNRIISVEPHRYEIDGKHVFAFYVPEASRADKPVYLKGDPRQSYVRRGAGDEQCTQTELERFLRDAAQERYDGAALPDIPVERCFDMDTVRWYQTQFVRRTPEHTEITDPVEFLLNWNFIVEQGNTMLPTRAGVLLFGEARYVRQLLPRPVLDYQRIDVPFDQWSAEHRWHDRYVFEENIFKTWQGLVARYMRIAEHPFSIDPTTLRRNDDPPDYVAFREAAINLLIHQDYGDHGRKASIRMFADRTLFWNPGDAFATEAELLEPTEKEVRNPSIVKAFRRIGLSDQAGTGIRAIFHNWHELGRVPPQLNNNKDSKNFELILINKPLINDAMVRFRRDIGVSLTPEQADVLALALEPSQEGRVSLTDIRSLGVNTTRKAKDIAEFLVRQQLMESVSDTFFELKEDLKRRFLARVETSTGEVTREVTGEVTGEVSEEIQKLLSVMAGAMKRTEIQAALGLKHEDHFRDTYLSPALAADVIEMTIPDKPRSSNQRYRLTTRGLALQRKE